MKFTKFNYDVIVVFTATLDEIRLLSQLSKQVFNHDMGVCQRAAKVGGFLYGWQNQIELAKEEAGECKDCGRVCEIDEVELTATGHQLGTMAKILESREFISGDDRVTYDRLAKEVQELMNDRHDHWEELVSE